jgi:hypothetical protein
MLFLFFFIGIFVVAQENQIVTPFNKPSFRIHTDESLKERSLSEKTSSFPKDTVFVRYNKNEWYFPDSVEYKTDTLIFDAPRDRAVLYGTTVFAGTIDQSSLLSEYGIQLRRVSESKKIKLEEKELKNRYNHIVSITGNKDSLVITIRIFTIYPHRYSYLCDIECDINKKNTINLTTFPYAIPANNWGEEGSYSFDLTFYIFRFWDRKRVQYVMLNGNEDTKVPVEVEGW